MDGAMLGVLLKGSLMDPILWVLGAAVGWDHRRPAARTASLAVAAGLLWGGIRVAVYIARGESLGTALASAIMAVCVALMVVFALLVREGRWLAAKR